MTAALTVVLDQLLPMAVARLPRLFLVGAGVYAVVAVLGLLVADRLIFLPPAPSYAAPGFPFIRVPLGSADSLAVLHLPNPEARYTVLYSHGNAEDLGHTLPVLRDLRNLGFAVVGYDYRGYGHSTPGPPTARKAVEDAEAVYQYATGQLDIRPDRLIIYGSSVGSGPAVELAVRHDPAGLILQSAFTSTFRVVTGVPLLPFDRFPNLTRLRDVRCPLLVVHGTQDEVVPWSHGKRLFARAAEPKQALWVEGAGHNDVVSVAGSRYIEALERFVILLEELARTAETVRGPN
jgi:fermentation-respiration switch protein FrsA (DUF1100 family)